MERGLYDHIFEMHIVDITSGLVGSITAILRCIRIRPLLRPESVMVSRLESNVKTYNALREARCSVCLGCWEGLDCQHDEHAHEEQLKLALNTPRLYTNKGQSPVAVA